MSDSFGINFDFNEPGQDEDLISLLFSLYMGKKNLYLVRSDAQECIDNHKKLMKREPVINKKFKKFISEEVSRIFRNFSYKKNYHHTPPGSSYLYKDEDINLHNFFVENRFGRADYNSFISEDILYGKWKEIADDFLDRPSEHSVKVIREKGKTRVITTNHPGTFLMKNIQWSVHGYLRSLPEFKYIGAAIRSSVIMPRREGQWLLSGDYSNSTDFIPSEYTRVIWDTILAKIRGHENMKRIVRHSLENEILHYDDGESIVMKSGQLMGGLLSFPALCLMNHCISKYLGIECKKVNGDDLLAWTTPGCRRNWVDKSEGLGMLPNDSKSHFHPTYGTFNSQLLKKRGNKIVHVDHFQVAKLRAASLRDIMNITNKNVFRSIDRSIKFGQIWSEHHSDLSLYNGNSYGIEERVFEYNWDTLEEERKARGTFLGSVGEMSAGWKKDSSIEELVEHNWTNVLSGSSIAIGNGAVRSYVRGEMNLKEKKKFEN